MDFFPSLSENSLPGLLKTGTFVVIVLLWLRFIGVPWSHIGRICLFCLISMILLVACFPP